MRIFIFTLAVLIIAPTCARAQAPRLYERSLKYSSAHKYLVYVPQNYDKTKRYPLFIALPRKGGPASEQVDQWNFYANREHYILLCPQFFGGFQQFISDEDKKLVSMMHEMKDEFPYDPDRVYIVGFSLGADFVQKFVFEKPGRVTAAGVLGPANFLEPPYSGQGRQVRYFIGVGDEDELSLPAARELDAELNKKGYDVTYREFPAGKGHQLTKGMKEVFMRFLKTVQ